MELDLVAQGLALRTSGRNTEMEPGVQHKLNQLYFIKRPLCSSSLFLHSLQAEAGPGMLALPRAPLDDLAVLIPSDVVRIDVLAFLEQVVVKLALPDLEAKGHHGRGC